MTDEVPPQPLLVGRPRELVLTALSEAVVDDIAEVLRRHGDEFRVIGERWGFDWDTVLQPEWYRAITVDEARAAVLDADQRAKEDQP